MQLITAKEGPLSPLALAVPPYQVVGLSLCTLNTSRPGNYTIIYSLRWPPLMTNYPSAAGTLSLGGGGGGMASGGTDGSGSGHVSSAYLTVSRQMVVLAGCPGGEVRIRL